MAAPASRCMTMCVRYVACGMSKRVSKAAPLLIPQDRPLPLVHKHHVVLFVCLMLSELAIGCDSQDKESC